jgi:hypothetical protein
VTSPNARSDENYLNAVTATSPTSAWAVGEYYIRRGTAARTLILRWDGTAWKRVTSPNPGGSARDISLEGVAASSPRNAWAAGYSTTHGAAYRTLTLHCDT